MPLPDHPLALLLPEDAGGGAPKAALPATATVCSCHNVSKGAIIEAVQGGATKAGTGCGGCAAAQAGGQPELLEAGRRGRQEPVRALRLQRQELFHLVKVGQIKSFDELLAKHGRAGLRHLQAGGRLDPRLLWNEHVLAPKHRRCRTPTTLPRQHAEERHLLGRAAHAGRRDHPGQADRARRQVAKKYDLYTKITGGQRIDLFGARLEQLPRSGAS
jgi:nitrite reductase (NADH) large subunit